MTELFSHQGVALEQRGNTLWVSGGVDATTAAALAAAGSQWLVSTSIRELRISFEGVDKASSAALSVLLEWLRISRQYSLDVVAVELSAPLRRLANLAELETLLAFSAPPPRPG